MNLDSLIRSARSHAGSQVAITVSVPLDPATLLADDPPAVEVLEFPGFDTYRFSDDFSLCWWFGQLVRFKKHQAKAMKYLFCSYENCCEEVEQTQVSNAAGCPGSSMERIFRGCNEWRMIIQEVVRDGKPFATIKFKRG